MDIRVMRYFLAIAQEENLTKAANLIHISQPSLSKQMKELEIGIGKNAVYSWKPQNYADRRWNVFSKTRPGNRGLDG